MSEQIRTALGRVTDAVDTMKEVVYQIVAIIFAFIAGALVLYITGYSPVDAYSAMALGAFGDIFGVGQTLMQATPIIFTSLAFLVSYKAGLFNIGAEGQFLIGAIAAAFVGIYFEGLPWIIHVPLILLSSMIGGGLWGLIPAVLKTRFDAHEVITTMMLSYIAQYFTSYLVNYPLKAPGWVSQTVRLPISAELMRILPPTQLSSGIYIAGVMVVLVWFLLRKTIFGYELRAIGLNPTAAENAGININKGVIISMVLSGAIAGLGGAVEIMGVHKRFIDGFSPGYGWDGLAVALVGGLDPFGSMLASVLFGALRSGGMIMSRGTGVPLDINILIQGLVILFVAAPTLIRNLLGRRKKWSQ
jgi:simple sugar transport system permease protein